MVRRKVQRWLSLVIVVAGPLGFGLPATASFPDRTATPLGLGVFPAIAYVDNLLVAPGPAVAGRDQLLYDGTLVIPERDGNNVATASYTRGHDLGGGRQGAGGIDAPYV